MNFVGKVLVVLQVVLSVVFMAFAGAVFTVQQNWRERSEQMEQRVATAESNQRDAEQALIDAQNQAKEAVEKAEARAETAEGQKVGLEREIALLKTEIEQTKTALDVAKAVADNFQTEAENRRSEAHLQRSINEGLHKTVSQLTEKLGDLEDDAWIRDKEMTALTDDLQDVTQRAARYRRLLEDAGINPDKRTPDGEQSPPPNVQGIVKNTKKSRASGQVYVEVSVGSDDGLRKGHQMFVYRTDGGGKYLGKIELILLAPDVAVGTLVEAGPNSKVQKGDKVATRL